MDSVATKFCPTCGETKAVDEFYSRSGKQSHLKQSYCKPCAKKRSEENQAALRRARGAKVQPKRLAVTDSGQKQCGRCKEFFPLGVFQIGSKLRHRCPACKLLEQAEYRESHRDQLREASRAYYASDPVARKAAIDRSIAANPDKYRAIHSAWKKQNTEAVNASTHKRRAVIKGGGSWTATEWKALKARFDWHCLMCGRRAPEVALCFDHVLPLDLGGPNVIANGQPLDRQCNSKKHRQAMDLRPDSPYDTRPDLPLGSVDLSMAILATPERYHKRTADRKQKACTRCTRVLPIESFNFRSLAHGWRHSACTDCMRRNPDGARRRRKST